jgi:hypothetical protein
VFGGHRTVNGSDGQTGPRLTDVARRAEVGVGTVSAVLNDRPIVSESTRARALAAVAELGYVRGAPAGVLASHWRRNGFATWLFQPAATGRYPRKAPLPAGAGARRPVAGRAGAGTQRLGHGECVLAADRAGAESARAAPHV